MNTSKYGKGGHLPARSRRRRVPLPIAILGAAVALVILGFSVQFLRPTAGGSPAGSTTLAADIFTPDGALVSNEPVVTLGVQVDEPAVNLGRQPLNTPVDRTFKLRNTGSTPVTLGRANIEVVEGCCPSDPILGSNRIEPGQEVPLLFSLPMGMHPGMGGRHLFRLTVPVSNDNGEAGNIEIYVKADFG